MVYLGIVFVLMVMVKSKMIIRTSTNAYVYIVLTIIAIVASLLNGTVRIYVLIRGASYLLPFFFALQLGAYVYDTGINEKRLIQIIVYSGLTYTIYYFVQTILNFTLSFSSFRENRVSSYLIACTAVIMITYKLHNELVFNRTKDNVIFILALIGSLINFSRASLLIIGITTVINILIVGRKKSYFSKVLGLAFVIVIIICIVIFYASTHPGSILADYTDLLRIGIMQFIGGIETNTRYEIVHNWRNHENNMALEQFMNCDLFQKLIGQGFRGVYVGSYASLVMGNGESGYIPLLHNAYYTILTYSGVLGLGLYVISQLRLVIKIQHDIKNDETVFNCIVFCLMLSLYLSATIIRGFIGKNILIEIGIVMGYYFTSRRRNRYKPQMSSTT